MAGRGWGKTRVGAEDMAWYGRTHPKAQMAILGRTDAGVRRVCIEGPSGLLSVFDRSEVREYNRSSGMGHIKLDNGSMYYIASAAAPDAILGLNLARAWCDELATWTKPEAWNQALIPAMRDPKVERPQIIVTTTPRPVGLVRDLVKRASTAVTRGSTWENADNLSLDALAEMKSRYDGTRLGRQELEGELLQDTPGALWTLDLIDADRRHLDGEPRYLEPPFWVRHVIGLDPSDGLEHGDEQGLCRVGLSAEDHQLYVLESKGYKLPVFEWITVAVRMAVEHDAVLVVEKNHGSAYLVEVIEQVMRHLNLRVPYRIVSASSGQSKTTRAESIVGLYEQHKVHHVGYFPELEEQMTSYTGQSREKSPDRLDSLVWALREFTHHAGAPDPKANAVQAWTDEPTEGVYAWS